VSRTATKYTIQDIAQLAGVSAKTVSRVVNNENNVASATRARVERIVAELGYQPHMGARSMRSVVRDSIGVTMSSPANVIPLSQDTLSTLFSTLYRIFGAKGYVISFDLNPLAGGHGVDFARGLWQQRYGAIIVIGPIADEDPTIHRVHASGYPYLTLDRMESYPECSSATVDFDAATYMSTKHLIDRGHRRIAMLSSFGDFSAGRARRRGYMRALADAGLPFDETLIGAVKFLSRQITSVVHRLLMEEGVTALIDASGSEDSYSLREGARRAGRVPGKDFEVVCWTYTDNATVLTEACAHVWLPLREAVTEGFELLADWFNGDGTGPISVLYPPTLYQAVASGEIPRPKPVFELLD
jgi:LacI family transcriptional regulator